MSVKERERERELLILFILNFIIINTRIHLNIMRVCEAMFYCSLFRVVMNFHGLILLQSLFGAYFNTDFHN